MTWIAQWRFLVAGVIIAVGVSGLAAAASSGLRTNVESGRSTTSTATSGGSSSGLTNVETQSAHSGRHESSDASAKDTNVPRRFWNQKR